MMMRLVIMRSHGRKIVDLYEPLALVFAGFIGGFLCPKFRLKGVSVGWGLVLEMMIIEGRRYAWGS